MARTFLQLCQRVARESGTISGSALPASVVSQSGRLLKVVDWTAQAWVDIQNMSESWKFLRKELPSGCVTVAGTARYTGASFSIDTLAKWVHAKDTFTVYLQSTGVADESRLDPISWADWRRLYGMGSQTQGKPRHYAISDDNELCLGPIPDAVYVVNGLYVRTPQVLEANDDEPLLPERFEMVIVWEAVELLAGHDEGAFQVGHAKSQKAKLMTALQRDQLPMPVAGAGPLA